MPAAPLIETVWSDLRIELLRFLVNQAGESTAEDLLQDVFMRLVGREDALAGKSSPRAWLYQVARHAVIDHWRRRRETVELPTDLADAGTGSEESIQTKLAARLRPLVESLPAAYADPLRLTELEGFSQSEAALRLGLSLTAVKSRVRRGRARLRAMLLECCDFEFSRAGRGARLLAAWVVLRFGAFRVMPVVHWPDSSFGGGTAFPSSSLVSSAPSLSPATASSWRSERLVLLALVASVLAIYGQTLGAGFVAFDDPRLRLQQPARPRRVDVGRLLLGVDELPTGQLASSDVALVDARRPNSTASTPAATTPRISCSTPSIPCCFSAGCARPRGRGGRRPWSRFSSRHTPSTSNPSRG